MSIEFHAATYNDVYEVSGVTAESTQPGSATSDPVVGGRLHYVGIGKNWHIVYLSWLSWWVVTSGPAHPLRRPRADVGAHGAAAAYFR